MISTLHFLVTAVHVHIAPFLYIIQSLPLGSSSPICSFHNSKRNWIYYSIVLYLTYVSEEVQLSFHQSLEYVNCYHEPFLDLYISYFLSPANLRQSSVTLHLEGFQQPLDSTCDRPGLTSAQQVTKQSGYEKCEFRLWSPSRFPFHTLSFSI